MEQEKRGFVARSNDSVPDAAALDIYEAFAWAEPFVRTCRKNDHQQTDRDKPQHINAAFLIAPSRKDSSTDVGQHVRFRPKADISVTRAAPPRA